MLKPLKSKKKIETIFEKGFIIKEGSLILKAYDFKDSENSFGVSVPKKIFASAVNRNRIKRLLKEGVRAVSGSVSLSPGLSFFLIPGVAAWGHSGMKKFYPPPGLRDHSEILQNLGKFLVNLSKFITL